jgi:outer membrane protein assembly factor BamE (lipoprotein component of BamABCDE complex)
MGIMKTLSSSFGRPALRASLLAGILALGLGACAQDIRVRGNIPNAEVVSKINPGIHSRLDIQSLLGSPSTVSTFQDSKWYYIGQKSTQFAFFQPEVLERSVLVVSFDEAGLVEATRTYALDDGQPVDPVDRVTPTEGREMSVLQQLLGNLGKFPSQ